MVIRGASACTDRSVYKPARTASGSFATAGAIFCALFELALSILADGTVTILYFVIFALGEVAPTVLGRPLLVKHRKLGFYHPAAKVLAEMLIGSYMSASVMW